MSCKQRKEWSNIIATSQCNLFHFSFKFFPVFASVFFGKLQMPYGGASKFIQNPIVGL